MKKHKVMLRVPEKTYKILERVKEETGQSIAGQIYRAIYRDLIVEGFINPHEED